MNHERTLYINACLLMLTLVKRSQNNFEISLSKYREAAKSGLIFIVKNPKELTLKRCH